MHSTISRSCYWIWELIIIKTKSKLTGSHSNYLITLIMMIIRMKIGLKKVSNPISLSRSLLVKVFIKMSKNLTDSTGEISIFKAMMLKKNVLSLSGKMKSMIKNSSRSQESIFFSKLKIQSNLPEESLKHIKKGFMPTQKSVTTTTSTTCQKSI